jgi:cold shock protein
MGLKLSQSGTVKFYNGEKGYGFIYGDKIQDVFFHISAVKGAYPPKVGERVAFYLTEKKGRKAARDIEIKGLVSKNKPRNILQGFPCVRGGSLKGFRVALDCSKLTTDYYTTVSEAQSALISKAKKEGANAIFNYVWHRESDWSDDYFLIWKYDRTRKTTFWAEGHAVKLTPT